MNSLGYPILSTLIFAPFIGAALLLRIEERIRPEDITDWERIGGRIPEDDDQA